MRGGRRDQSQTAKGKKTNMDENVKAQWAAKALEELQFTID